MLECFSASIELFQGDGIVGACFFVDCRGNELWVLSTLFESKLIAVAGG